MNVFVGLLYAPKDEERVLAQSRVGLQSAANNYQWGIIKGLHTLTGEKQTVINSVPMGSFPKHCGIWHEKQHVSETEDALILSGGYLNLPVCKQMQRKSWVLKKIEEIAKEHREETVTVLVYSLYSPFLKAMEKCKLRFPNIQYILIVPDLPGKYGIVSGNALKRTLLMRMAEKNMRLSALADKYVVLTKEMVQPLCEGNKPYTVIEGIYYGAKEKPSFREKGHTPPVILFTGSLEKSLGMDVLLKAFSLFPENTAQLWVAGSGSFTEEIKRAAQQNPAIRYLGFLPKSEIDSLQRQADVLVNPRSATEEYTKYSFPSKTMEYLATGTPVVMNRLPGVPAEYEPYIHFTKESTAKGLADAILQVLRTDPAVLQKQGEEAKAFILSRKSSTAQATKLLALIDDTSKRKEE